MSKIGVGVGEEFPVDEHPQAGPRPGPEMNDPGFHTHDYCNARHEWRRQRREWKRQWRAEWRARRHAFREQFRQSIYDRFGPEAEAEFRHRHYRGHFSPYMLVPILAVAGGIAVLIALISHPLFLLALIGGGLLFAVLHHHHDENYGFGAATEPAPPSSEPRDTAH